MRVITLVALLSLIVGGMGLPLCEGVFAILLLAPVFFFIIAESPDSYAATYWMVILGLLIAAYLLSRLKSRDSKQYDYLEEIGPMLVFGFSFIVFHGFAMLWPDFIAIGERLRDYALLASVIESPIDLKEPWLPQVTLNYYAYWYRFGHMLSKLLGLQVWEVYHQLQAFTFALYCTFQVRLLRRYIKFSWPSTLFCALLICLGSNLAGIDYFRFREGTWWAPSRVIPGAIHEFPVWSFLLGDNHPHFLNLAAVPLLLTYFLCLVTFVRKSTDGLLLLLFCGAMPLLLIYNSNAWDTPIWAGLLGLFAILLLLLNRPAVFAEFGKGLLRLRDYRWSHLLFLTLGIAACFSLYLSSTNIDPADYPWRLVGGKVARSQFSDLARHWGFPLALIAAALAVDFGKRSAVWVAALFLGTLLFFSEALPFLLAVACVNAWRVGCWALKLRASGEQAEWPRVVMEVLGIAAIGIILIPEVVFLDDPYGGENERMNTIFKLYSINWFIIHAFAFYLVRSVWLSAGGFWRENWIRYTAQAVSLVLLLLFFGRVAFFERRIKDLTVEPHARGLSSIDKQHAGAAKTIIALSKMERGNVLEAQGNPYSYTSHVSTLAAQPSYLGWANHVELLTKRYDQINHRKNVTREFYQTPDCQRKRALMQQEGIRYVVVGPLERKQHAGIAAEQFACLNKMIEEQQYAVYGN